LIEERLIMLQTQYDDERARTHDLQLKLAEANSQRIEIESKLNKSSSSSSTSSDMLQSNGEGLSELRAKMARTQSILDDELRKNKKFEENIEYLSEAFVFLF
jgi:chromosome segregation ATPase